MRARRHHASSLAALLVFAACVPALSAPFDMSPELGGAAPTEQPAAPPPGAAAGPAPAAQPAGPVIGRYLLPAPELRFEGEMGQRSWGVSLTAAQAAQAGTLVLAVNSSIYVAPESSRLRVTVNDRLVVDEPLAAHEAASPITTRLPPDTFRPGVNVVTVRVDQRHRTDCTIESTYQLWTEIDGGGSGIIFDVPDPGGFVALDDLLAVGVAGDGTTAIRLVLPPRLAAAPDESILDLVQAITLRGGFGQPVVGIASALLAAPAPGTIEVAVGTIAELAPLVGRLDPTRSSQVGFVDNPGGPPLFVVAGADQAQLAEAINYAVSAQRLPDRTRSLATTSWLLPDVPVFTGAGELSFLDLGLRTEEFSGRRFRAEFNVAVPGDFYAGAYGQATILLDAAYADDVRRGSHFDVYTNGILVANVPLSARSGDIFRHLPVKVPLAHFRPGVNSITLEAVLDTEADVVCAPGTPGGGANHFALFDTSVFRMPDFGRISRWPDLAAFAGGGAPYGDGGTPVQIVLARVGAEAYAAAATILSRLSRSAGRMVPAAVSQGAAPAAGPAIFVGALGEFAPPTLAAFNIDERARTGWVGQASGDLSRLSVNVDAARLAPDSFGEGQTTTGVYDRWQRERINPGGIRGTWLSFERWLERTFNLSLASLSLTGASDPAFDPPRGSILLVGQVPASDDRAWTIVAAPTPADLAAGTAAMIDDRFWSSLSGRIASFTPGAGFTSVPAMSERYVLDRGFSFQGLRLVVANWLSINIVTYAIALLVLCSILGLCTSALLARLGRNI